MNRAPLSDAELGVLLLLVGAALTVAVGLALSYVR